MKLVLLDVDGTLTATNEVDTNCFVSAFTRCFGVAAIETDWTLYRHATDLGILQEVFAKHFGRDPSQREIARMRECFLEHLQRACTESRSVFVPIDGAAGFLAALERQDWVPVIATGCWASSARFKLEVADLPTTCPVASSEDGVSREAILRKAVGLAQRFYGTPGFSRVVSVGDGVWDVKTAQALSLPFTGVARGPQADRLRELGASHVLTDFVDLARAFEALESALVPGK
ncbi:MAG: HAD family hydrolase [Candidatus Tectomicrobia bacterium]|uniref:phosphoglycolate phosphatase n=1 Tax=Tectimicrobiota bacterium TaxID=2528274 RepID=A0A932GM49_UNCTE|nr:HAD family hydrolase [Candidatus Tectomicrobia bacterium]